MSSFFCGTEAELESRFSELIPDKRSAMCYFIIIVFSLFMILNTEQFVPNMLLIVVVTVCFTACILWTCPCWKRRESHAAPSYYLREHNPEQRVHVPPFATRAQLSDVRIQLALLDRDFDYRDYEALRALDDDIIPEDPIMSEGVINVLPDQVVDHIE